MIYRASDFVINSDSFEIFYKGTLVNCEPKVFDLILYLVQKRQRLVTRDELFEKIWQGREVTDTALSNHIKIARKLLGDNGQSQSVIKTIRGRGYQFVALLEEGNIQAPTNQQSDLNNFNHANGTKLASKKWVNGRKDTRKFIFTSVATLIALAIAMQLVIKLTKNFSSSAESYLIAVVPFSNTKPSAESDYLGIAISDRIISELAYLEKINVRSANSTRKFNQTNADFQQVGNELNVDYVLSGNYLSIDNVIRLDIELIRVSDNHLLWRSKQIEVTNENTFKIQDMVANEVLAGFKLTLDVKKKSSISDQPQNPIAYDLYLKSIAQPFSNEGHQNAIDLLKQSIKLEDSFAPAYIQLGNRIRRLEQFGLVNTGESHDTLQYYQKALSLNPNLLSALSHLAFVYTETNRIDEAMEIVLRMLEINPFNAQTRFTLGYVYRYAGLIDEAISEMERAVELDPRNRRFRSIIATYSGMSRFQDALAQVELYPKSSFTTGWRGLIDIRLGKTQSALKHFEQLIEKDKDSLWGLVALVHASYLTENIEPGLLAVHRLEQTNIVDAETIYYVAVYYCMLGDNQRCLTAYKKSVDSGYYNYHFVDLSPYWTKVKNNPEFIAIYNSAKQRSQAFANKFLAKASRYQ